MGDHRRSTHALRCTATRAAQLRLEADAALAALDPRCLSLVRWAGEMTDALPGILILGSVIAGFAWGKISARLPIPEWLRLLTMPVWTGTLMVIAGWFMSVTRLDWNSGASSMGRRLDRRRA